MSKLVVFIGVIVSCVMISCTSKTEFDTTISIPDATWNKQNTANFSFDIQDTSKTYDIMLSICNNDSYQFSNVYIFTTIKFPDNKYTRDTIEFFVADMKGEWTGSGMKNYTNTYAMRSNIRFPKAGKYTFSFEQAMRCVNKECDLYGIESIGLSLIRK